MEKFPSEIAIEIKKRISVRNWGKIKIQYIAHTLLQYDIRFEEFIEESFDIHRYLLKWIISFQFFRIIYTQFNINEIYESVNTASKEISNWFKFL